MRLRGSGIKVVAWLAHGLKPGCYGERSRESAADGSGPSRPGGDRVKTVCTAVRATMIGFLGIQLPERLDSPPLSAELAEASPLWLVHPAWGAALLGFVATVWLAYKRYQDMQRAASASADLYEAVFQAMPCPMFCKDARGRYVAVNRAYEAAFGGALDVSSSNRATRVNDFVDGNPSVEYASCCCEEDGFPAAPRADQAGPDRRFRTAALEPCRDGVAWIGVLAEGNNETGQGNTSQSPAYGQGAVDYALLSAINHDVRTPLTGILGALELLEYSELTTQQRDLLRNAESASKNLQGILDDVLSLARLEAGATLRENQPFDPREVAMGALAGLDGKADIVKVLDDRLAQRLLGDGACLRHVLTKLVVHAISRKLGKPWHFEAHVLAEGARWQSVEFVLEVSQDDELSESLLSPFASDACRADELAWITACKFCEWMGVTLQEQGRGWAEPRFVVRGCFSRATDAPSQEMGAVTSLGARQELATVLVAEDHELVREVIGRQLAALGWSCDLVCDGEGALEALARRDYALLITDRHMPKMDGLELARRVREAEDASRMPIVLLTANLPEDEGKDFHDIGIDEAMCKPTSLQSLSRVLAKWVVTCADTGLGVDGVPFAVQIAPDARQVVERLHAVFGGDIGAVDDYLRLLRNEQGRLKKRMEEGDAERIREVAHSLSGIGSFFGAQGLAGLATTVELSESASNMAVEAEMLSTYLGQLIVALHTSVSELTSITSTTNQSSDGSDRKVSGAPLEI